ncbi:MAG: SusC/RagA family TonB-linked outer membrane protein [Muribaculaceae bacterium]|nr:SusC/RagA family TonB-linked outer membrane protein [Muribaculaceae bacterium]MDE6632242.1 SusC/RagA family TonB-linked outer membrane protein [Muribaculaceae bacterium]
MRKLFFIMMAVLACSFSALAQTNTYRGTVVDAANDEPLVGATVVAVGSTQAVATDLDGNFNITVPSDVKQVKVSYVGYNPMVVALKDNMTVMLQSTTQNLDDLVVVAYGTASKESLTGSVAVVNEKEIEKRPVSSVTSALEGMSPGVQVNGSTTVPGESPTILIRGINSVNGTTSPLYVVDGVIFNGEISDLNPNDVENISVLKDAASCALYGAKGANGVVLITTKRAKGVGRTDVTVKIRQGAYERALPQYDRLGYNQWNEAMLVALANGTYTAALKGANAMTREQAFKEVRENFFSQAGVMNLYAGADGKGNIDAGGEKVFDDNGKVIAQMMPGYTDLDWWDAIGRTGYRQEYNVSATGATEKFNFFASLGYLKENGYIYNNDFQRWNARLRGEITPVKYLKLGFNLGVTYKDSANPQFDADNLSSTSNPFSYQTIAPGLPYYLHDWTTGAIKYGEDGKPIWDTTDGYPTLVSNRGYTLRANSDTTSRLAIDGNVFGQILLPYGFDVMIRANMNRYRQNDSEYMSPVIGSAKDFGRLTKYFRDYYVYDFQQTLNWSHEYGLNHIDVMLNHENYNQSYEYSYVKNRDQLFPNKPYLSNFTNNESVSASAYQYRTESYMARARYNYNQQYYLELSLNRDASSRFSKEHRWGTFWSVGASWILSKEKFLQDAEWLNFLKLRASYGTAGNDYTGGTGYGERYYPYMNSWSLSSNTLNGDPNIFPTVIGNPDLHWEATKTFDAALETNMFNNRLNLSVGYFLRTNSDLIYTLPLAPSTGTSEDGYLMDIKRNIGDMQNWGWEIALGGTVIRTQDWQWDLNVDATFIKNKITKLPAGNQYDSPRALIEGKSRYEWYMPKWAGVDMMTGNSLYEINKDCYLFQSEKFDDHGKSLGLEFDENKWQSNLDNASEADALVQIGDRYYTTNRSYASDEFCGTSLPTVYGSFGTNLRWKNLSFGALFTYSLGGKTLNSTYNSLMSPSAAGALHVDALNAWTHEMAEGITEDSPNRINPNINPELNTQTTSTNNAGTNSRWLISSSYLALKNINVSYDLPKKWMNALLLKGMTVGFSMDNVFISTKCKGMNPTYTNSDSKANSGGQGNYFVPSRVYTFELTARF